MNFKDSTLNSYFFLIAGNLSLLIVQSMFVFSPFFDFFIPKSAFPLILSFNCGGLVSLVVATSVGERYSKVHSITFLSGLMLVSYFGMFLVSIFFNTHELAFYILILFGGISGFSTSWRRSILTAIAAEISPSSIKNANLGAAIGGVLINIYCSVLAKVFVINPKDIDPINNTNMYILQFYWFTGFIITCFIVFFVVFALWYHTAPKYNDMSIEIVLPADPKETKDPHIIMRSSDINMGIFMVTVVTTNLTAFWIYTSWKKFNINESYPVALYLFGFNICDVIAKSVPVEYLVSNINIGHAISFIRISIVAYFLMIVYTDVPAIISGPMVRFFIAMIGGITNGYMLNSFMCMSRTRFLLQTQKSRAAFYNVFFLLFGAMAASALGVMLPYDPSK